MVLVAFSVTTTVRPFVLNETSAASVVPHEALRRIGIRRTTPLREGV